MNVNARPRVPPLPTRDGVGPSCVALPEGPWPTIAAFLVQRFPLIPAAVWAARIANGEVVDEHGMPVTAQRPHQARLRVFYYRAIDAEPRIPFTETVLFQDELLVVADKPHFLSVTPGGRYLQETLLVRLKRALGIDTLVPIHRLDRETAGVIAFSAQPATRGAYAQLFAQRQVVKQYEAIAPWRADLELPLTHRSRLAPDAHFMRMADHRTQTPVARALRRPRHTDPERRDLSDAAATRQRRFRAALAVDRPQPDVSGPCQRSAAPLRQPAQAATRRRLKLDARQTAAALAPPATA